ncbi:MAG: hypothetical protein LBC02_00330 [Planctomycetaceae bacterium]|nr:hypothetical protein [Planctomycetaceae bacterium]
MQLTDYKTNNLYVTKWEKHNAEKRQQNIALGQERHDYENRLIPTDQSDALHIKM